MVCIFFVLSSKPAHVRKVEEAASELGNLPAVSSGNLLKASKLPSKLVKAKMRRE